MVNHIDRIARQLDPIQRMAGFDSGAIWSLTVAGRDIQMPPPDLVPRLTMLRIGLNASFGFQSMSG